MKKAVILHGTDGKPTDQWFPWLEKLLEESGYEVYLPTLPNNHTPNRETYEKFLRESGWDFTDNLLIGHSSGATTILNLLSADWFPRVKAVVLVGTFLNEKLTKSTDWYEPGQFDHLFLNNYDPEILKTKADNFYFVHGNNDPYCDINDAKSLCNQLGGDFVTVEKGHHLGASSGFNELFQLKEKLEEDGLV
jgi:hypothetical protein